jgi:hypothetical protein
LGVAFGEAAAFLSFFCFFALFVFFGLLSPMTLSYPMNTTNNSSPEFAAAHSFEPDLDGNDSNRTSLPVRACSMRDRLWTLSRIVHRLCFISDCSTFLRDFSVSIVAARPHTPGLCYAAPNLARACDPKRKIGGVSSTLETITWSCDRNWASVASSSRS